MNDFNKDAEFEAEGRKKRVNPLAASKIEKVDFKDINVLKHFVTENGKILPARTNGVTAKQQRQITRAVKRARVLGLLPFAI